MCAHSDRQKKLLVLPCNLNVTEKEKLYTSYKKLNLSSLKGTHTSASHPLVFCLAVISVKVRLKKRNVVSFTLVPLTTHN